jgi:hypothetical protein
VLDRARATHTLGETPLKGEREFVRTQPVDSVTRPSIQTAVPRGQARRRDDAIIQAELRRLAQLGGRVPSEPRDAADREHDAYPEPGV